MRHSAHALSILLAVCLAASGCDPSAAPSDASDPPEQTRSVGQALDEQSVAAARDTYVEQNAGTITDYDNFGAESGLIVGTNPKDRALVAMDEAAIATAVGGGTVVSARLVLTVQSAVWGGTPWSVGAHRLTEAWTELGATHQCPDDSDTTNSVADCAAPWAMNANDGTQPWVAAPTATATGASTAGSLLTLDVTSDVSAFLAGTAPNHGWLLRPETGTGQITFDSRETTHPPYLILDIDRSPECGPVDDGDPCTEDVCSSTTGDVSHTIMVGASCDVDGTVCNGEDTCDAAGVCIPGTPPVVDDDGNPCTLDACDPALGVVHTPKPAGASCSDGLLCNGAERCDGAGTCMPGAPLDPDDSDESTIDLACDPTDGVVHIQAPPIDPTVSTSLDESLAFLIEGADPLQGGVAPGTIVRSRAAAIEGYVRYANGNPVGGASVEVFGHPELGATITDAYGHYIMLINAGGTLTVSIDVAGFLPVQRRIATAPRQTAQAADAVVIPVDDVVTEVDLDSIVDVTVVRGSVETDSDGARQATLLIPPGVDATLQLPGGGTVAAPALSLRLTEYTVGDEGPDRMPADLPPTSGYTYCVEISADEALQENATGITLSAPVALFVDNYRSFPIGTVVPAGTYDRARAQWVSDDDGRVIRILAVSSGVAQIDSTGDGVAETTTVLDAMGLTTDIREALADTYEANDELVFVRRTHFSPTDLNFPFWPVQPSCRPLECSAGDPQPKAPRDLDDPCEQAK